MGLDNEGRVFDSQSSVECIWKTARLTDRLGLKKSSSGPVPNILAPTEMVLDRQDTEILFLGGKERRLVAKGSFERRHASIGGNQGIVGIFYPGKVSTLIRTGLLDNGWKASTPGRVECSNTAEGVFQVLVSSLSLAI